LSSLALSRYTIYDNISRGIFIVFLPLLQSVFFAKGSLITVISGNINLVLAAGLLLWWASADYRNKSYFARQKSLSFFKGVFIKREQFVPNKSVHSRFFEQSLLQRFFKVASAYTITADRHSARNNRKVIIRASSLPLFFKPYSTKNVTQKLTEKPQTLPQTKLFKKSNFRVLLMAIVWSNAAAGLLFLSAAVKNIGRVFGKEYETLLTSQMDLSQYIATFGVPPLAAYLSGLILVGFCAALIMQFLRYFNLQSVLQGEQLQVTRGLFKKSMFLTEYCKINCVTIKQSLLMMLLRLESVYIHTIGSGTVKGDKSLVIPATSPAIARAAVCKLIDCTNTTYTVTPKHKTKLALTHSTVIFNSFYRLNRTTFVLPFKKVQSVAILQNPFQRFFKTCTIKAYVFAANRKSVRVFGVPIALAKEFVREYENVRKN
jgi:uncharacterized membrane protein YdbT with pleckstrin-like domain